MRDLTMRSMMCDIVERSEIGLWFERFSLSREGVLGRGVMMECLS